METIELQVYSFDELSESSKENAIRNITGSDYWGEFIFSEAYESLKRFADIFNIDLYDIDFLETYRSSYKFNIPDEIEFLNGVRLLKYIWNNYKNDLYKGKFYGCIENDKQYFHKRIKSKRLTSKGRRKDWFNPYYSGIKLDNDCVLTGVCYDNDLLNPIYDFLDKPNSSNLDDLLNDCIKSLCSSVKSEYYHTFENDYISDHCQANEYQFTEDGELF